MELKRRTIVLSFLLLVGSIYNVFGAWPDQALMTYQSNSPNNHKVTTSTLTDEGTLTVYNITATTTSIKHDTLLELADDDHPAYLLNTGDTATGDYNFDSNTFVIDSTNDRVGIDVSPSTYTLEVGGDAGFNEYFYHNADADTYFRFEADKITLSAGTNPTQIVIQNTTQDVININADARDVDTRVSANSITHALFVEGSTGNVSVGGTPPTVRLDVLTGGDFNVDDNATIGDDLTVDTTTFHVDSGNNRVGIGTAGPQGQFHVGASNIDSDFLSGVSDVIFDGGVYGRAYIQGSSDAYLGFIDSGAGANEKLMQLGTINGVTKFRSISDAGGLVSDNIIALDHSNGNVGIGIAAPTTRFETYTGTSWNQDEYLALVRNVETQASYGDGLKVVGGADSANSNIFAAVDKSGNTDFVVQGDGLVGIGTTPAAGVELDVAGDVNIDNTLTVGGLTTIGDGTDELNVEADGDFLFINDAGFQYGCMAGSDVNDTLTITGTGQANKVQITSFNANVKSNGGVAVDHTNDHITVTTEGWYMVIASVTVESDAGGGADTIGISLYKNNGATEFTQVHAHRRLAGGSGDVGSISLSGICDVAANDTLELWIWNESSTDDLQIDDITFSVFQVGGT